MDDEPKLMDVRKLGSQGGKARAKNMTAKERSEAARQAAAARWVKAKATKKAKPTK